jgi:diguanylate cyclase (GGDEF)-like protein
MRESIKSPLADGKLAALFLTADPLQRLRIRRSLLSVWVFVVCVGLIAYAIFMGIMDPHEGAILTSAIVVSCAGFYLALRSGLNLRFADPALTLPQTLAAITWIAGAYGTTNASHGGTLMLLALVLVFGIFSMNPRRARISGVYTVFIMGLVMLYKSWTAPLIYPAKVEWMYFVFVLTVVPTITTLSSQLANMRQRLKDQKTELGKALERIRDLATRDELTGLINRRQMNQVLVEHAALDKRSMVEFSVVVLDLDFFKRVNDTYGHRVGDEVLRNFAAEARRVLRETDVIARWGGEEFLLMMPEVPPGAPAIGIERLHRALAALQISATVPELRISFSAGITTYRSGELIEEAIERADQGLYQAKASGRNQSAIV